MLEELLLFSVLLSESSHPTNRAREDIRQRKKKGERVIMAFKETRG
jgi:hypothetical protein